MPVKKKRKSYGVAVAVAEDGGLKKCKISSYCRSQPPARLVRGEEIFQERSAWLVAGPLWGWFFELPVYSGN
uniref:Uncharacterized protein n=1 Tax=Castor canadensis TaxID=51338 RepID=A0A8C0WV47_CASCN